MRARTHTRAAQPLQAVPEAGTPAPAGVAAGIARAQGGGERLAPEVRREMESALCADFGAVRVHADGEADRLNRKVDAAAFTLGNDVFFRAGTYAPENPAGRQLLAHELTHVAQQHAAHASTDLDLPGAPHASLAPDGPAEAQGVLQRKPFQGPQFPAAALVNTAFAAHRFQFVGLARGTTGCGTHNRITTGGEQLNNTKSKPGTPVGMALYKTGFSRKGGLVRDRAQNRAVAKMHLINHRLENSVKTQRNQRNIFLGTLNANNPTHLNEVEQPVIDALTAYGTQQNLLYQAEMAAATKTHDNAGGDALFWPQAQKPNNLAVKHAQLAQRWLIKNDPLRGTANAKANATDAKGWQLVVDANTPANNYRHLWLVYDVTGNYLGGYGGIPAYVQNNAVQEAAANNLKANPTKALFAQKITDFKNGWAENAFPADFDCSVTYYSATYKPWAGAGLYQKETENHNIDAAS